MTPQEIKALTVEGLTDKVESLSTMVELLKAERDAAMREASELAMSIWRTEFKKLSPDFDLCDSPAGVISQIDNMYAAIRAQRDALAAENIELRQRKLIHIGFTNESQVQYVTEDEEEGAFYPNSDHGCYIPVYMLNVHAHRVGPDSKIYCTHLEQGKKIAEIRAEAGRAGFVAGCHCGANYNVHDWDNQADQYAATVQQGTA